MKVEKSQVTRLLITGADRLDPVKVFIEDTGERKVPLENDPNYVSRQGSITIECYGESWSTNWGGMGPRTVAQFFCDNSIDYLAGCLARGTGMDRQVFSGEALARAVRRIIVRCRRGRDTSHYECGHIDDKDEARRLYDEADELSHFETFEGLYHSRSASGLLTVLFTDEWHHAVSDHGMVPHPKYEYLQRIIGAVQEGLRQLDAEAAA